VWGIGDLDLEASEVGLAGSPTQVRRIFAPPQRERGEMLTSDDGNPDRVANLLLDRLVADGLLES
jgi:electron transfer flavoprotein beta subunit